MKFQRQLHTVSSQYVLVIPANRKLKAYKSCENKQIKIIESPSLVNIPLNCGLSTEQTKFWNYKKVLKGSPFFLPPLKFINLNLSKSSQNIIQLNSIDLNKIKTLKEQAESLKIDENSPEIHPVTWSLTTSILILLIITIILVICWRLHKKKWISLMQRSQTTERNHENNPSSLLFSTTAGGVMWS